jgi:hypothetical protein
MHQAENVWTKYMCIYIYIFAQSVETLSCWGASGVKICICKHLGQAGHPSSQKTC